MNGDEAPARHGENQPSRVENRRVNPANLCSREEGSEINSDADRIVSFNEIAGGATEVIIEHEGQKYRLRATRNGRLLLNK